jgi:hypothetical protein
MDDDRGDGRWRARAVGVGHGASVCRHVRRSVWDRVEGVRVVASPSWPLGRSFRRSTPWRGASLPPGAGRDCLTDCPSSRDGEHRGRRASVCRGRTVPGFMSDGHGEPLNETARAQVKSFRRPCSSAGGQQQQCPTLAPLPLSRLVGARAGGVTTAAPAGVAQRMILSGEDLSAGTVQWGNRAGSVPAVGLTDRDLRLMALTHDVNFLSASQLVVLGWGDSGERAGRQSCTDLAGFDRTWPDWGSAVSAC